MSNFNGFEGSKKRDFSCLTPTKTSSSSERTFPPRKRKSHSQPQQQTVSLRQSKSINDV